MTAVARLNGFPAIHRLHFFQGSGATPGRLVVDTLVTNDGDISRLPQTTSLSLFADGFSGGWNDLRVVKPPRVRSGYMRTVLEDSRWKLAHVRMGGSYNRHTSLGSIAPQSSRTIFELLSDIADSASIPMTVGSLPVWQPPADWAGRTAASCLDEMLRITGCRMVYDPWTHLYKVSSAGTGSYPSPSSGFWRPGPTPTFRTLRVLSAPVLFEDRLPARAVQINGDGSISSLVNPILPSDDSRATNPTMRAWQPTSVSHPEILPPSRIALNPHRAASMLPTADTSQYIAARLYPDEWSRWPHHLPAINHGNSATVLKHTSGGETVLFDHPVICGDGSGGLKTTGDLLTSYYVRETSGALRRYITEVTVNASGSGTKVVSLDWIKPVVSTQPDMTGNLWFTIQSIATSTLASRYSTDAKHLTLLTPIQLGGSGQIGGVLYRYDHETARRFRFDVAINYDPKTLGGSNL